MATQTRTTHCNLVIMRGREGQCPGVAGVFRPDGCAAPAVGGGRQDGGMTEAVRSLATPRSIAFGGYFAVLARGLSPDGLAHRLAEAVRYGDGHVVEEAGEH